MKTHIIKTPTAELMIVETSEQIILNITATGYMLRDNSTNEDFFIEGYTLLGKPYEIREEDAAQLIPMYFDHERTAVEYLIEMIQSEIYWNKNPLGKEKPNFDPFLVYGQNEYWVDLKNKWHEAEQKTFDRKRSIILKKVTPKT